MPSTRLLATSDSDDEKKPKPRLRIMRSSSVRPFGSCQVAMSAAMFTSCGIQWLAQPSEVLLPGPGVLEGHELIDVGAAVDDLLFVDGDAVAAELDLFQPGDGLAGLVFRRRLGGLVERERIGQFAGRIGVAWTYRGAGRRALARGVFEVEHGVIPCV